MVDNFPRTQIWTLDLQASRFLKAWIKTGFLSIFSLITIFLCKLFLEKCMIYLGSVRCRTISQLHYTMILTNHNCNQDNQANFHHGIIVALKSACISFEGLQATLRVIDPRARIIWTSVYIHSWFLNFMIDMPLIRYLM